MTDHQDSRTCELHDTELIERRVAISYGYPLPDPAAEVRDELFPNSRSYVLGGCVFRSETYQTVLACDECRKAEDAWRTARGGWNPLRPNSAARLKIKPWEPKE